MNITIIFVGKKNDHAISEVCYYCDVFEETDFEIIFFSVE